MNMDTTNTSVNNIAQLFFDGKLTTVVSGCVRGDGSSLAKSLLSLTLRRCDVDSVGFLTPPKSAVAITKTDITSPTLRNKYNDL